MRVVATLMQVSVGRGTLKWVRLREIRPKNDVSERPETLATYSMQRALDTPTILSAILWNGRTDQTIEIFILVTVRPSVARTS